MTADYVMSEKESNIRVGIKRVKEYRKE